MGKRFLKVRVVDAEGERPGVVTAVLRNLFFIMPIFPYAVVTERMLAMGIDPNDSAQMQAFAMEQSPMLLFLMALFWLYLVSCLVALFHAQSKALHDLLAGTQVIKEDSGYGKRS